jgi:hypothetical protein
MNDYALSITVFYYHISQSKTNRCILQHVVTKILKNQAGDLKDERSITVHIRILTRRIGHFYSEFLFLHFYIYILLCKNDLGYVSKQGS